jgi:hypothetical protein
VTDNLLDLTLLLEVAEGLAGETSVDLQTIDQSCDGDEAVGLHVLVELLGGGLVEDNSVVGLVLDYIRGENG